MRRGRPLEILVRALELTLADKSDCKIHSPKMLYHPAAKRKREFDVVIESQIGPRTLITAIECKDWKRRVGVATVEAFCQKCRNCGVNKGVIVSAVGFSELAIREAEANSIQCLGLDKVESFDWFPVPGAHVLWRHVGDTNVKVIMKKIPPQLELQNIQFSNNNESIPHKKMQELINNAVLNKYPATPPFDVPKEQAFVLTTRDIGLMHNGQWYPVQRIEGTMKYTDVSNFMTFQTVSYRDATSSDKIADMAYLQVDTPPFRGHLVFRNRPGEGTGVFIVPDPDRPKKK